MSASEAEDLPRLSEGDCGPARCPHLRHRVYDGQDDRPPTDELENLSAMFGRSAAHSQSLSSAATKNDKSKRIMQPTLGFAGKWCIVRRCQGGGAKAVVPGKVVPCKAVPRRRCQGGGAKAAVPRRCQGGGRGGRTHRVQQRGGAIRRLLRRLDQSLRQKASVTATKPTGSTGRSHHGGRSRRTLAHTHARTYTGSLLLQHCGMLNSIRDQRAAN